MYNLACLRDSNVCVADLETYNLGNVLRKTVLQGCPLIDIVFCSLENSEMERLQLTDPSLHVCTGKLQNWQNHLRDRKKYLCIKFCYTKPVMIFFINTVKTFLEELEFRFPPSQGNKPVFHFFQKNPLTSLFYSETAQLYLDRMKFLAFAFFLIWMRLGSWWAVCVH